MMQTVCHAQTSIKQPESTFPVILKVVSVWLLSGSPEKGWKGSTDPTFLAIHRDERAQLLG